MSVSMLRPFFISIAGMVVLILVGFLCGILPESPFLAFIQAEEVNEYLEYIVLFIGILCFCRFIFKLYSFYFVLFR